MARLVPLVLDDAWTAFTAAAQLGGRPYEEVVLRRARARVLSASPGRESKVAPRAVATLDLAPGSGPTTGSIKPTSPRPINMDSRR
ncbi:MAG TPA: hypothetical protein VLX59_15245 [Acidimicrobiales bacterium]|nr:hypothetical protein [Acidimicrobiales bacterium]